MRKTSRCLFFERCRVLHTLPFGPLQTRHCQRLGSSSADVVSVGRTLPELRVLRSSVAESSTSASSASSAVECLMNHGWRGSVRRGQRARDHYLEARFVEPQCTDDGSADG